MTGVILPGCRATSIRLSPAGTACAARIRVSTEPVRAIGCRGKEKGVERVMGIEPTSKAWEAFVLPLNYTRVFPGAGCNFGGLTIQ